MDRIIDLCIGGDAADIGFAGGRVLIRRGAVGVGITGVSVHGHGIDGLDRLIVPRSRSFDRDIAPPKTGGRGRSVSLDGHLRPLLDADLSSDPNREAVSYTFQSRSNDRLLIRANDISIIVEAEMTRMMLHPSDASGSIAMEPLIVRSDFMRSGIWCPTPDEDKTVVRLFPAMDEVGEGYDDDVIELDITCMVDWVPPGTRSMAFEGPSCDGDIAEDWLEESGGEEGRPGDGGPETEWDDEYATDKEPAGPEDDGDQPTPE